MEAENGGGSIRISPDEAADAQCQHPADYEVQLTQALDLFAQNPEEARRQFPEFSEHFKMSEGRENPAGEETL